MMGSPLAGATTTTHTHIHTYTHTHIYTYTRSHFGSSAATPPGACLQALASGPASRLRAMLRQWWAKAGSRLQKAFPLDADDPGLGSWLFGDGDGGEFKVACKSCRLAGGQTEFCTGLLTPRQVRIDRLREHEATASHRMGVIDMTGNAKLEAEVDEELAPSLLDFLAVWDARMKPGPTPSLPGIGSRHLKSVKLGRNQPGSFYII